MSDFLNYGINAWVSFYQRGTASIYVPFAFVYLAYLLLDKKNRKKVSAAHMMALLSGELFLLLLFPGSSQLLNLLNPTGDASNLFFLVPTAMIMGITAVELYQVVENGDYGRFHKQGLFIGVAALFITTLSSPFIISTGHFTVPRGFDKISKETYEIAEAVGNKYVLLPKRYAASIDEISAGYVFTSMPGYGVDESDPEAMAQAGMDLYCDYVVVDKTKLNTEGLTELEDTFSSNNYTLISDQKKYALFQRGSF